MLTISGTVPERRISRILGEYTPFEVTIGTGFSDIDKTFYWRSTDSSYLLEVKIEAGSGVIAAVDLVLVPKARVQFAKSAAPTVSKVECGVPVVDLTPWMERIGSRKAGFSPDLRRIDEPVPFTFLVGEDGLSVLFDSPASSERMIQTGNLCFLCDPRGSLTGVFLAGLSETERRLLVEVHGRAQQGGT